jgi:hypothetical protein
MSGTIEHSKSDLQRTTREILRVVLHRRWAFIVPFCIAATLVFAASHRLPRVYRTSTVFERQNTIPIAKVLGTTGPESMAAMRLTMEQDMLGIEAMGRVAERMGLTSDLEREESGQLTPTAAVQRKRMASGLRGGVTFLIEESGPDLDRVRINATGGDPGRVVELVNAVRDTYTEFVTNKFRGNLDDARDFYEEEIEVRLAQVDGLEEQVSIMYDDFPYVDPSRGQAGHQLLIDRNERDKLKRRIDEYERKISFLDARLKTMPEPILLGSQDTTEFLDSAAALETERRRLKSEILGLNNKMEMLRVQRGMRDTHPDIQRLSRMEQFARMELAAIDGRVSDDIERSWTEDPVEAAIEQTARESVLLELATARESRSAANEDLTDLNVALAKREKSRQASIGKRPAYRRLTQEMDKLQVDLEELRKSQRQIARVLDIDDKDQGIEFATVQEAHCSSRPVLPKSQTVIMLALGLGLACGACAVFLREFLDHTFRTAGAVGHSLGVQVLEGIDEIVLPNDRRNHVVKRIVAIPAILLFAGMTAIAGGMAYVSIENPPLYKSLVNRAETTWAALDFLG